MNEGMERITAFLLGSDDDPLRAGEVNGEMSRARSLSGLAILLVVPLFLADHGIWPVAVAAAWVGWSAMVTWRGRTSDHVGLWVLSLTVLTQLVFGISAYADGGPTSPVMVWLVVPLVTAPARYGDRGVAISVAATVLALLVAALGHGIDALLAAPQLTAVTLSAGVGCLAYARAMRSTENQQRRAALIDPLTRLPNRSAFARRFDGIAERCLDRDAPMALLVCDLDHFKRVNDDHGHDVGDAVLVDVARALRSAGPVDTSVYRFGGEEFVVLVPGAGRQAAELVAERLREHVAAARPAGVLVTISIGGVVGRGTAIEETSMFSAADQALYDAKRAGRDRVLVRDVAPAVSAPLAA